MVDTIAAISTGLSNSGISIIRVSGPDAFQVMDCIFRGKNSGKKLSEQKSHTIHYGWITEGEEIID